MGQMAYTTLNDDEHGLVLEAASATHYDQLEDVDKELTEAESHTVRNLAAQLLESGAAERHFDEDLVEQLYERLTDKHFNVGN